MQKNVELSILYGIKIVLPTAHNGEASFFVVRHCGSRRRAGVSEQNSVVYDPPQTYITTKHTDRKT